MKKLNHKKNLYKSIILIVILAIGIGYAYLTSNLSITGSTEVVANTWNIHFENLNVTNGSVSTTSPATIDTNQVDITYAITLSRPKDFYEFTVDVKNDGTLPGKVSISELSGLDSTSSKVVDYSIKYSSGRNVSIGDILNAGMKNTIKVRVYYKDDITEDDFPENNLNLNLTYTLQYVQSEEDAPTLYDKLLSIGANDTCITKYNGQVTEQVNNTVTASNVYIDKCSDKRNVIFGGYCWQVIRTTDTKGVKLIYNGEPVDGKCESTRENHKGIIEPSNGVNTYLYPNILFSDSFTYDTENNTFTLNNPFTATLSNSTYENLLGKYTCENSTGTCTSIKNVNEYGTPTGTYLTIYTIGDTHYSQIGTSAFNADDRLPSKVGYMFNKEYKYETKNSLYYNYIFGNSFKYENGEYTLDGETKTVNSWSSEYSGLSNTHYTCWNNTGICDKISYIFNATSQLALSVQISDGEGVSEALNNMLYTNDVNKYDSSVKGILDNWYRQNLISITNRLEDVVYCNARDNTSLGGWSPSGYISGSLTFKNFSSSIDLSCTNITDQFSLSNNKAKLTYPVALIQNEELHLINDSSLMKTNQWYWTISPFSHVGTSGVYSVTTAGWSNDGNVNYSSGVRPVVSIKYNNIIAHGTGSETDPWIVE